jgi:hypothetical protein
MPQTSGAPAWLRRAAQDPAVHRLDQRPDPIDRVYEVDDI